MPSFRTLALGLSLSAAVAQAATTCNPTEKTCTADEGLDQSTYTVDFTQGESDDWNVTYGTVAYDDTNGATYTISESGDAPTMQSNFYIFFGSVSVVMKTAPGTGIVSCAILESDDLDEIDWEWLGGTPEQVETNYFGKGNTSTWDRETYVDIGADAQSDFHNYTIVWTKATTTWMIDGSSVRTLAYADANSGQSYPQTPMRVKLGIWAGGDSSNSEGTIEWAGGATDYDDGPFTAYIKSISITNYNPGSTYTYGDLTGSYSSIEIGDSDSDSDSDSSGSTDTSSSVQAGASSATISTSTPTSASSSGVFATISMPMAAATPAHRNGTSSSANSTTPAAVSNTTSSSASSSSSGSSSNPSSSGSSSSASSTASGSSSADASSGALNWRGSLLGAPMLFGVLGYALVLA